MSKREIFPKPDELLQGPHPGPWTVRELETSACVLLVGLVVSILYGLVVTFKLIDARHELERRDRITVQRAGVYGISAEVRL